MTIEEFLLARFDEAERGVEGMRHDSWLKFMRLIGHSRTIVEWHKNWPVLVETPPKFEPDFETTDINHHVFRVTQEYAWLTQQEYRKKFGSEPPTAPLLRQMAAAYSTHPDFQEEWAV